MNATEIKSNVREAVRIMSANCRTTPIYVNRFFGPAWATTRAEILTALRHGCRCPKSKAGWHVFLDELMAAFGIGRESGSCAAVREDMLDAAINAAK